MMKKLFLMLVAVVGLALPCNGQGALASLTEGLGFGLAFDHSEKFAVRAFTNGVFCRAFSLAEVAQVASGATNSYRVSMPGLARGTVSIQLSVVDAAGVESDLSAPLVVTVKAMAPWYLRRFSL